MEVEFSWQASSRLYGQEISYLFHHVSKSSPLAPILSQMHLVHAFLILCVVHARLSHTSSSDILNIFMKSTNLWSSVLCDIFLPPFQVHMFSFGP
jgi:hypothetical protein